MADSPGNTPHSAEASAPNYEQQELRQRAFRRVLIAIALILAAIVVLNALNRLRNSQRDEVLAPAPSTVTAPEAPASAAPEVAASTPEAPASEPAATTPPAIEQPASNSVPATPAAASTAPAPTATVAATPHPAPPEVINNAGLPQVNDLPGTPLAIAPATPPTPAPPKTPQTKTPPVTPPAPTAAAPVATPTAPSPAPSAPAPHLAGFSVKSYTVQLGVFARYDNAQQLYQRLRDAGVPAQLESRVTLGPFRDRAEAAQAMAKMKQMGLAPVLVPNAVLGQ